MKNTVERSVERVVIATGIASVTTQLLIVREFLTQFQGNEFVIALILFNWLVMGGAGTLLAKRTSRHPQKASLSGLTAWALTLAVIPCLQLILTRVLRDVFFVHGSSVGFYPTLYFTFALMAPYAILVGYLLPYSLIVLNRLDAKREGARLYILDNIGDIAGGALFSFLLVHILTPMRTLAVVHLLLMGMVWLIPGTGQRRASAVILSIFAGLILISGVVFETRTLNPFRPPPVFYKETRFGRVTVEKDREQFTLYRDGAPVYSNENRVAAEETVHYPLSQLDRVGRLLIIAAQGGMFEEAAKYAPEVIDYVELDPAVTEAQFRYGMLTRSGNLNVIHRDGRAWLASTSNMYDAVIINLPEPDTFQVNRFFTDRFFGLVKQRLKPDGILCFSMEGVENYLSDPQREKLSCVYRTAGLFFRHVRLIPGVQTYFLCRDLPIREDIPEQLAARNIRADYIRGYFHGEVSPLRIRKLNDLMDANAPVNSDLAPRLMRLMFVQWFAKYGSSPLAFVLAAGLLSALYLTRLNRSEFILYSTGCVNMGAEILVIFAFQIFYGYIYVAIGLIVTVFLGGLLPGAMIGRKTARFGRRMVVLIDGLLLLLLAGFALAVTLGSDRLPVSFYLAFGFTLSLVCGWQFPVALRLSGGDNRAAAGAFSADLVGAACGIIITSVVLMPYFGMMPAVFALMGLKCVSLLIGGTGYGKNNS